MQPETSEFPQRVEMSPDADANASLFLTGRHTTADNTTVVNGYRIQQDGYPVLSFQSTDNEAAVLYALDVLQQRKTTQAAAAAETDAQQAYDAERS